MKNFKKDLAKLRKEIDFFDIKLLNVLKKRLNVVKEIGILKSNNGSPKLDKRRWNKVLTSRISSGKKLNWDAAKERFTDEAINKEYLMKEYQNGYHLPKI